MSTARQLHVVANELPDPPYPADVRARGWGFTLDIERIRQSEGWMKCRPRELRNAMLRVWMESWAQAPCGSLPNDDDLIAEHADLEPNIFAANRAVLMRGWYLTSDGRLYHPVITELVEKMRDSRKADRERKAKVAREVSDRKPPETAGVPRLPPTGTGTVSGTGTGKDTPRKRGSAPAARVCLLADDLVKDGVDRQVALEWLAVRKTKRLTLTHTAWTDTKAEAAKAQLSPADAIRMAVVNSWGGFKAAWVERTDTKRTTELPWHQTGTGIMNKGVELGVGTWSEDAFIAGNAPHWLVYRAKVYKAAGYES